MILLTIAVSRCWPVGSAHNEAIARTAGCPALYFVVFLHLSDAVQQMEHELPPGFEWYSEDAVTRLLDELSGISDPVERLLHLARAQGREVYDLKPPPPSLEGLPPVTFKRRLLNDRLRLDLIDTALSEIQSRASDGGPSEEQRSLHRALRVLSASIHSDQIAEAVDSLRAMTVTDDRVRTDSSAESLVVASKTNLLHLARAAWILATEGEQLKTKGDFEQAAEDHRGVVQASGEAIWKGVHRLAEKSLGSHLPAKYTGGIDGFRLLVQDLLPKGTIANDGVP